MAHHYIDGPLHTHSCDWLPTFNSCFHWQRGFLKPVKWSWFVKSAEFSLKDIQRKRRIDLWTWTQNFHLVFSDHSRWGTESRPSLRRREKCSALVDQVRVWGEELEEELSGLKFSEKESSPSEAHMQSAVAGRSLLPDSFPQKSSETEPSSASLWLWQFMLRSLPPSSFFLARLTAARRETDTEAILTASQRSSIAELWSCLKRRPAARTRAVSVHCGVKPVSTNLTAV